MTQHRKSRRPRSGQARQGTAGLIALMTAATLALVPLLATDAPAGPFRLSLWMVTALVAAAELAALHRHGGDGTHTLSLSELILVIGLVFAAPGDLVLGTALAGLGVYAGYRRLPLLKVGFNTVLAALETAIAVVVFRAVLGSASPIGPRGWLATGIGVIAATVVVMGAVRAFLAVHGERTVTPETRRAMLLSLGLSAYGTVVGLLAAAALWLSAAAFSLVAIAATLAYGTLRALADQAATVRQRAALEANLAPLTEPMATATVALESMCQLLRIEAAEAVLGGDESLHRICARDGAETDHAKVSPLRRDYLLGSLGDETMAWGRRLPRPIRLELASRGFRNPVVAVLADEHGPFGYLAAGSKRSPERRLSRADRQVLDAAARHLERACRGVVLV
ncbi:MAG: hypothetical protein MUP76_00720 [Acidimicrobiia bacterium]|nr:hypothetical protein [Acidimicrobiia bacterium]